jgi:ribonuclease J
VADPVRVTFLGGLGEIGRNCAAIEIEGRILLVDCGLMFPDAEMPGVDLVLPDFTWLRENADRLEAVVLTHGHEDHVGALSFLLRELSFPIYGSALTLGLARSRIEEAGLLERTELIAVADGERRAIGPFDVEFIPVTHSVPHGFALAFHTPQGVVLHTGDWKLDLTPVDGRTTDLGRIGAMAGEKGIRLLLSDSTNAEEEGHTPSERSVGKVLRDLFRRAEGKRILTACFASHLHRIQQIVEAALETDRTVATLGRSMGKNVALARSMGLLSIPDSRLVDIEKVADGLYRLGADVVHSGLADVHVSGHAQRAELRTMLSIAKPEFFIPIHGEFRHLTHHARVAMEMGVPASNVLLAEDGDVVELSSNGIDFAGNVPAGYLYVDGIVGDVGHGVLRDRRVLAEEGVVVVIVTVDVHNKAIVTGPEIVTRGWVYAAEAQDLLEEAAERVRDELKSAFAEGASDLDALRRHVRRAAGSFVSERTRRRPMIVPVVMEV